MFQTKVAEKIDILRSNFFSENRDVYEIRWKIL